MKEFLKLLEAEINSDLRDSSSFIAIPEDRLREMILQDYEKTLSTCLVRCCVYELNAARKSGFLKAATPEARFAEFFQALAETDNRIKFFKKYPEVKKQIDTSVQFMRHNRIELFKRIKQDFPELELMTVESAGDSHCHGQSSKIISFQNKMGAEIKYVYKPRPLAIEIAYHQFLNWLNNLSKYPFLCYQIIDKGHYGWCEFVEHKACDSLEQTQRYFYRFGALVAIFHLLHGLDIHHENIIAHAEHPVIVDGECLFYELGVFEPDQFSAFAHNVISDSCFLGARINLNDALSHDISAFAGYGDQMSETEHWQWQNKGSDTMRATRERSMIPPSLNRVILNDKAVDPMHYQQDVLTGFEETYALLVKQKALLLSDNSPLQAFKNTRHRILFRGTSIYAKLLYESFHPKLAHDKKLRDEYLNVLNEYKDNKAIPNEIIAAELEDLNQGDIPFFYSTIGDVKIYNSSGIPQNVTRQRSGWDAVIDFIKTKFDEKNLQIQKQLIWSSFAAIEANQKGEFKKYISTWSISTTNKNNYDTLTLAEKLLTKIAKLTISRKSFITWPNIEIFNDLQCRMSYADNSLYSGIQGIALTFAYSSKLCQNPIFSERHQQCLESFALIAENNPNGKLFRATGLFEGLGGFILYRERIQQLDDNSEQYLQGFNRVWQDAETLIKDDTSYDLIAGNAGLIHALQSVDSTIPTTKRDELIEMSIKTLLEKFPDPAILPKDQKFSFKQSLLGCAHGLAGICAVLAKYNHEKNNPVISNWITRTLTYEAQHFHAAHDVWPDLREYDDVPPQANSSWCHGTSGIGSAKLALRRYLPSAELDRQIEQAVKFTRDKFDQQLNLCLCHGLFGSLDFLMEVQALDSNLISAHELKQYIDIALSRAADYIQQLDHDPGLTNAGLMIGATGVAYQLLRIANPTLVPSILSMK